MSAPTPSGRFTARWPGFPAVWVDASWSVFDAKWRRWERTRPGR